MKKEHPGSRDMFDIISQWQEAEVVVSKNFGWARMGILGILGDYVVRHTTGDILEIGIGESSIFLGKVAQKYSRKIYHCDIATSDITNMNTIDGMFIPNSLMYDGPSDAFFKNVSFTPIAMAFIDGDHTYKQVRKDFFNTLPLVVPNGYIFLHDTYPPTEDYTCPHSHCGDVYKLRQELEMRDDMDCFTFLNGAMSVGLTMIRKHPMDLPYYQDRITDSRLCQKLAGGAS